MSVPALAQSQVSETRESHTHLLRCALALDESRAYWERVDLDNSRPRAEVAFEEYWFGAKSLPWVKLLIANMRARFDAFPEALAVIQRWHDMLPETRAAICHWHVQLTDPIYRRFSGDYLTGRHHALRPEVRRTSVITWLADQVPESWTLATRKQMASKLLSTAFAAGLVGGRRDPRPLVFPRINNDALSYLLHLLREVEFEGPLVDNPYLRSVGLEGSTLAARLRSLPTLRYRRTGDVIDFGWRHPTLAAWAEYDLFSHGRAS